MADKPGTDGGTLDAAIAATGQVRMTGVRGTFGATGRPFALQVPEDMTIVEALALVKAVVDMPEQLAARRGPRLFVPRTMMT